MNLTEYEITKIKESFVDFLIKNRDEPDYTEFAVLTKGISEFIEYLEQNVEENEQI